MEEGLVSERDDLPGAGLVPPLEIPEVLAALLNLERPPKGCQAVSSEAGAVEVGPSDVSKGKNLALPSSLPCSRMLPLRWQW